MTNVLFGGAALAAGAAVAFLNYWITGKWIRQLGLAFSVRQVINVAFLCLCYFLGQRLPCGLLPLLAGAAVGLTIPSFLLTGRLRRQLLQSEEGKEDSHG